MRYLYTSGIDFLVELLRQRVQDPKYVYKDEVGEVVATASGTADEAFYTSNLPILSGADRHLRVGRWKYTEYDTELECAGLRGFTFSLESGMFVIPDGAVLATTGDTVKASYTWVSEQETSFRDEDLKLYIADAVNMINDVYYNFGHTVSGNDVSDINVYPNPGFGDVEAYLYVMYASILIRREIEAGSFGDRIYVRDINITIDTSKGLGDLSRSIKELELRFQDVLNTYMILGQNDAFTKIDTYSTHSYETDTRYDKFSSDNRNF